MSTFHLNHWLIEKTFTQHNQHSLKLASDYLQKFVLTGNCLFA